MTYVLGIDTAQPQSQVVLGKNGEVVAQESFAGDRFTGRKVLEAVEALIQAHGLTWQDISRIGVNAGPGGYGSLRMGVVVAGMLAQANGIDLVQLSPAEAAAMPAAIAEKEPVAVVTPAYNQA